MRHHQRWVRRSAAAVWITALGLPLGGYGCDEATSCEGGVELSFAALNEASVSLRAAASGLKADVFAACSAIANDLGENVDGVSGEPTDEEVTAACDAAVAAIDARLDGGVSLSLVVEGGYCAINADAQLSCEADCSVDGSCNPGTIETRCEAGELSAECDGKCAGSAVCQGSAAVETSCEGECSGACTGKCNGTDVEGSVTCSGKCSGTCSGDCKIASDATVDCGADVRCKGQCNGTATAPRCEAALSPPACDIAAECKAGCNGQGTLDAECVPPTVRVTVEGGAAADLQATLEANLPTLIEIGTTRGELIGNAAAEVGRSFLAVVEGSVDIPACVLIFGQNAVADAQASIAASASVNVSVKASASVTAKTGG